MAEINLQKRVVYAGDVHIALLKSGWSIREACDFVNGLPKADVAEVRHGRLVETGMDEVWCSWGKCTVCGWYNITGVSYCNECGTKLDGGADK